MPTKCELCPEPKWFGTKRGKNVHRALMHKGVVDAAMAGSPPRKRKFLMAKRSVVPPIGRPQDIKEPETYVLVPGRLKDKDINLLVPVEVSLGG